MIHNLIIIAIHLLGLGLIVGIIGVLRANKVFTRLSATFIVFCAVFLIIIAIISSKKPIKAQDKPLTQLIFENSNIQTIKIYKEPNNRFSVDFNNIISYDDLSLDSLKLAIEKYPVSIYNTKKE